MTRPNRTSRWLRVALMGGGIAAVFACTDVTFDERVPPPSFAPGATVGPATVPRADRNDIPMPWSSAGLQLAAGVPYRIVVSGMLTFTPNPAWCAGAPPLPSIPSTVGPAGFAFDPRRPWKATVGIGTQTTAPTSTLSTQPTSESAEEISANVKGPGVVWTSRSIAPLFWSCSENGGESRPGWWVSGTQLVKAVELERPQVVADRLSVPAGDTVLFTLQVGWSTNFFIGSGTGWRWVSDTTTNTSTLVNSCPRTLLTCRVVVREKGHAEVQNVVVEGMSFDARSPIVVVGATACDPEVETMLGEYETFNVNLHPTCPDFSNTGGTAHFSWSDLNGGFADGNPHNPWGMVKAPLTTGLEATYTNYNRGDITLTSAYRCPHGNAAVGGVQHSYHMHGRAGDMKSTDHPWTEEEFNLLKAAADSTGTIESLLWTTYADHHYHAAW